MQEGNLEHGGNRLLTKKKLRFYFHRFHNWYEFHSSGILDNYKPTGRIIKVFVFLNNKTLLLFSQFKVS